MTLPPSSRTAISNVERVRSDGLSNSSATCAPASAWAVGAFGPNERSRLRRAASDRHASSSEGSKSSTDRKSFARTDAPVVIFSFQLRASSYELPATSFPPLPVTIYWKLGAGSWKLLGSVIRVDLDVLCAQVAGPDRGLLRAAGA